MAIVILHGWSDHADSFKGLREIIAQGTGRPPLAIYLADWLSLQDDVTMTDLADAMQRAWLKKGLSLAPGSHDLVVHSTGALVVREWMTRFFTPATVPIKRLVMMAPANFGSGLAHKGMSFIGRAVKGWNSGFQTGTQLLRALELASPYSAELANRDLFDADKRWYGAGAILATVLVGDTGYDGIRSIANEAGSDGTVRISTANLNAARLDVKLGSQPGEVAARRFAPSSGEIAFGVLAGHNHGSIISQGSKPIHAVRDRLLLAALAVRDADYTPGANTFPWQTLINQSAHPDAAADKLQNTVVYLSDHLGHAVDDYFLEFYRNPKGNDKRFEQAFYERVVAGVHAYGPNKAWRALYLDINGLRALQAQIEQLFISVSATPAFKPPKQPVGYLGALNNSTGELRVQRQNLDSYFVPHRTLIVRLVIPRYQSERVFELN